MLLPRRAVSRVPPEIWEAVLEHLAKSPGGLARAARALRSLFEPATRVLWRSASARALLSVSDAQRRQLYGRAVRTLLVIEADEPLDMADWRFPGLRTVCYDFYTAPQRPGALEQLLQRCRPSAGAGEGEPVQSVVLLGRPASPRLAQPLHQVQR